VSRYQYDDFGRILGAAIPDNSGLNGAGIDNTTPYPTLTEYNSLGLPTVRQTVGMQYFGTTATNYRLSGN
jgi:hypothetical protein